VGRKKLHPGLLAAPVWGNFQPREARQTLSVRKSSVQQPYALSETGLHPEKAHLGGLFLVFLFSFGCAPVLPALSVRSSGSLKASKRARRVSDAYASLRDPDRFPSSFGSAVWSSFTTRIDRCPARLLCRHRQPFGGRPGGRQIAEMSKFPIESSIAGVRRAVCALGTESCTFLVLHRKNSGKERPRLNKNRRAGTRLNATTFTRRGSYSTPCLLNT
jgi:hypothetical protein